MTFQIEVRMNGVKKTLNVDNNTFQSKADALRHVLTWPGYRPQFVVTDPDAAEAIKDLDPAMLVGAKYDSTVLTIP